MKLGPVIHYTHTGSDGNNDTQDELAFVLRDTDGPCVDLVVFPVGGPVRFVQACEFDPDDPYLVDGGSYVREMGSDAPDFSERFKYSGDPEYAANLNRIRKERDAAPGNRREELKERHKAEMTNVISAIEERNRPEKGAEKPEPREPDAPPSNVRRPAPAPQNPPGGPPNPGRRDV